MIPFVYFFAASLALKPLSTSKLKEFSITVAHGTWTNFEAILTINRKGKGKTLTQPY